MATAKWMDLNEFREAGYLQEVNRRFFHPLGLALAVDVDDDGNVTGIAGVYDDRSDPDGWVYGNAEGDNLVDPVKAENIERIITERAPARIERMGWFQQPVEGPIPVPTTTDNHNE